MPFTSKLASFELVKCLVSVKFDLLGIPYDSVFANLMKVRILFVYNMHLIDDTSSGNGIVLSWKRKQTPTCS